MSPNIFGKTLDKLTEEFLSLGQSSYRGKQVFSWLYEKRAYDFDSMSDISKSFRETLKENYSLYLPKIHTRVDAKDGTVKFLLEMEDSSKVEAVLMPYSYGNAVCASSEVGCSMGCAFCASGLIKKSRGLTAAEMVGEVLVIDDYLRSKGEKATHVVVMGTGEPFDNYDNVIDFIKIINSPFALAIGARHITVSTCGLPEGIRKYGKEGLQVNLAISLHAPNDEIRSSLMPINKAYPLSKLMPAIKEYENDAGRRVTFEYILLKGINDSLEQADELSSLIKDEGIFAYINLIPYNEVEGKPYKRSSASTISAFHDRLLKNGINATIRKEFGSDIDAACGQLRVKLGDK